MEKWKAKRDFAAADDLFQRKKYNEALEVLNRLNREYPNNRRVMMPRALCLAEMGRYHEAATLCEQILAEQEYPRARRLLTKLQPYLKSAQIPLYEPPGAIDRMENEHAAAARAAFGDEPPTYLPPVDPGDGWGRPLLISAIVIVIAAALGGGAFYLAVHQHFGSSEVAEIEPPPEPVDPVPLEDEAELVEPDFSHYTRYADPAAVAEAQRRMAAQEPPAPAPFPSDRRMQVNESMETAASESAAPVDAEPIEISDEGLLGLGVALVAMLFVVFSVLEFTVLFCTLLLLNKMPRPALGENLLLIAGVAVAAILISSIPYVGKFASLFMIITVFQLSFVDCLVMLLVHVVVYLCAVFVFVGLIGMSLGVFL